MVRPMNWASSIRRIMVVLAVLAIPADAAAACLSPSEARQAIAAGEAVRLGDVARRVGGEILDARLCEAGGRLVYQLAVMTSGGNVERITVDARSGRVLN